MRQIVKVRIHNRDIRLPRLGAGQDAILIRGVSGSGKSSLLRVLACPHSPNFGHYHGVLFEEDNGFFTWVDNDPEPRKEYPKVVFLDLTGDKEIQCERARFWSSRSLDVGIMEATNLLLGCEHRDFVHEHATLLTQTMASLYQLTNPRLHEFKLAFDSKHGLVFAEDLGMGARLTLAMLSVAMMSMEAGGLLLVDSPENNQHISVHRGLVATLNQVARIKGGTLIVASQAPDMWEHFWGKDVTVDIDPYLDQKTPSWF